MTENRESAYPNWPIDMVAESAPEPPPPSIDPMSSIVLKFSAVEISSDTGSL